MAEPSTSFDEGLPFRRAADLEEIPLDGRIALYRSDMEKAVVLNRSATLLWQHLETPRTRSELVGHLMATFPAIERPRLEADVTSCLRLFSDLGIIVPVIVPKEA